MHVELRVDVPQVVFDRLRAEEQRRGGLPGAPALGQQRRDLQLLRGQHRRSGSPPAARCSPVARSSTAVTSARGRGAEPVEDRPAPARSGSRASTRRRPGEAERRRPAASSPLEHVRRLRVPAERLGEPFVHLVVRPHSASAAGRPWPCAQGCPLAAARPGTERRPSGPRRPGRAAAVVSTRSGSGPGRHRGYPSGRKCVAMAVEMRERGLDRPRSRRKVAQSVVAPGPEQVRSGARRTGRPIPSGARRHSVADPAAPPTSRARPVRRRVRCVCPSFPGQPNRLVVFRSRRRPVIGRPRRRGPHRTAASAACRRRTPAAVLDDAAEQGRGRCPDSRNNSGAEHEQRQSARHPSSSSSVAASSCDRSTDRRHSASAGEHSGPCRSPSVPGSARAPSLDPASRRRIRSSTDIAQAASPR